MFATYKMEWKGGNIEKIAVYSDRSQPDMTIRYTYDTKVNPFKDFYCIELFSDGDIPVNAYNNIERAVFDYYDGSNHRHDVALRSYEYDGLFPTMIRTQNKYGDDVVYIEYE